MFKSLISRYILISLILLSFMVAYIYAGFVFTNHIRGDATRINMAGQLRFRSFEMAWLIRRIIDAPERRLREPLIKELSDEMTAFEAIITDLKSGSERLGIMPLENREALVLLNAFSDRWSKTLKPMLLEMKDLHGEKARPVLDEYESMIHGYVDDIHRFVNLLVRRRGLCSMNTNR
ncbi:MAG: hypothetical protein OHK0032_09630 [Thermodesulfovibrionales bacterium]